MLHPTKLPDCADRLEKILDFQERLLELGCGSDRLNPSDIEENVGVAAFAWLNSSRNNSKLFTYMCNFSKYPQAEKDSVLNAFRHDRQFNLHASDPNFQFQLVNSGTLYAFDDVKKWLTQFYEQLGSGFDASIVDTAIAKQDWHQGYKDKNYKGKTCMCTVCDGTLSQGSTIEHVFPKALYPSLSVHPHNLIPMCPKCNADKGNRDPLDGTDLAGLVLPYHSGRSVREVARLKFISRAASIEEISLVPNVCTPQATTQLQNFARHYKIPQRWQDNIHEISEMSIRTLRQRVDAARDEGIQIDTATLPQKIDQLCSNMEKDWGMSHFYYPATEWLRWAKGPKLQYLAKEVGVT